MLSGQGKLAPGLISKATLSSRSFKPKPKFKPKAYSIVHICAECGSKRAWFGKHGRWYCRQHSDFTKG